MANTHQNQNQTEAIQRRAEPQTDKHFVQSQGIAQKVARPSSNPFVKGAMPVQAKLRAGIAQMKAHNSAAEIPQNDQPIQAKSANSTGMPDSLKSGVESLSGIDMSDVKVHYNSDKPAQLQAHAYAQGTDIHLASGQEKHLPHEAWHVVQQKQGRVQPTTQMKSININDDSHLENEADVMGAKASSIGTSAVGQSSAPVALKAISAPAQRVPILPIVAAAGYGLYKHNQSRDEKLQGKPQPELDAYSGIAHIKVSIAGSGNNTIKGKNDLSNPQRVGGSPVFSRTVDGNTVRLNFAGPGAGQTVGVGYYANGISDSGSNSIENLMTYGVAMISQIMDQSTRPKVNLVLKAHSRGAVAASHIAAILQNKYGARLVMDLELYDPVPGPMQSTAIENENIAKIKKSTVVYSIASGYGVTLGGFAPEKVIGAKRLILSKQNHGGGLQKGYRYQGKNIIELNNLPEGVYIDYNDSGENTLQLIKVNSAEEATGHLKPLLAASPHWRDRGRVDIITAVINAYFK